MTNGRSREGRKCFGIVVDVARESAGGNAVESFIAWLHEAPLWQLAMAALVENVVVHLSLIHI